MSSIVVWQRPGEVSSASWETLRDFILIYLLMIYVIEMIQVIQNIRCFINRKAILKMKGAAL